MIVQQVNSKINKAKNIHYSGDVKTEINKTIGAQSVVLGAQTKETY